MIEKDYYNGWNDESNLDKILSCPFCGGNGELLDDGYEHPVIDENGAYVDMDIFEGDTFWIECEKCGAMITGADTPEKAIEEWNTRTPDWIPVEKELPPEPPEYVDDEDDLEQFIVMIDGAKKSTVLRYAGDGAWWEDGTYYPVIAWQSLPEPYNPDSLETRKELERRER